jgi:hypothetical protein
MKKSNQETKLTKTGGGPRTNAGKEKTRLNALTHGLYSRSSGSSSKHHRLRARLYRRILARLVSVLIPVDVIEEQWVDIAADALVRKALVLRWEGAVIVHEIDKVLRAVKELETELARQRKSVLDLEADLARLEEEKETGLRWTEPGGVRDSFLVGVVHAQAGEDVAETFLNLSFPEERKNFFYEVVKWDEATLWNHLVGVMRRSMESHALRAEELAAQLERGKMNNELELAQERASLLSKENMEFVLDSVNKCNRQFSRAIDSLMRYRESKSGSGKQKGSRKRRLDQPTD